MLEALVREGFLDEGQGDSYRIEALRRRHGLPAEERQTGALSLLARRLTA